MFDIGTTAVLLDAAQDLNEALQGGAALSLIPIGIGTIVGIGIVGFFAQHIMKKGDEARRNDPNPFKRLNKKHGGKRKNGTEKQKNFNQTAGFYGDAWSNLYCAGGSDTFSADSCGGISGI